MKARSGKKGSRMRVPKGKKATPFKKDAILELVKAGVRRFVSNDAPIGEFQRLVREAARKGEQSSHPLTGLVFRRIVRQAIRDRKRQANHK